MFVSVQGMLNYQSVNVLHHADNGLALSYSFLQ